MKKRILSVLITVVILIGMLPVTAFAAATNTKVFDPVYYDSGALKSITTSKGNGITTVTIKFTDLL